MLYPPAPPGCKHSAAATRRPRPQWQKPQAGAGQGKEQEQGILFFFCMKMHFIYQQ